MTVEYIVGCLVLGSITVCTPLYPVPDKPGSYRSHEAFSVVGVSETLSFKFDAGGTPGVDFHSGEFRNLELVLP